MAYYFNILDYIKCSSDTIEKINRIEAVITALEDAELLAASNSTVEEYWLDDGQTKIKAINRDLGSIERTILLLEKRKIRLQNECVGYRYGLQDGNIINC